MVNEIEKLGLKDIKKINHNLSYDELFELEKARGEGRVSSNGTFMVDTGIFTGRSPKDKYFVKQDPSQKYIAWGKINQPISKELFDKLLAKAKAQLSGKEIFIQDAYCGASKSSRKNVRFVTEVAWQAHFVKNMFIRPSESELAEFHPDFVVYNACKCKNEDYASDGLHSDVFVIFNVEENVAVIGGTWYGGEMKKGIFSMMNYWLPLEGKLSMHCSANVGKDGDTALFFGLSGTGKTTLSTDPNRKLIGDDEHGWDDEGIFNFEGGCYAKCINLDPTKEPDIYGAIRRDALLENLDVDAKGKIDFSSTKKTENTRVSYPIYHIKNIVKPVSRGGHAQNVIFLTADAFGVLPPVSMLTPDQMQYHFLSGFTAKLAGTERGITEPQPTFSSCFGQAFLTLHPTEYARELVKKMEQHHSRAYLVNTGWIGGAYGVGKRIDLPSTRAIIDAILRGDLIDAEFETLPIFNLRVPKSVMGVDPKMLNPRNAWANAADWEKAARALAEKFVANFKNFTDNEAGKRLVAAGPQL